MRRLFRKKSSCEIARDRLKILLISDRVNCSAEMMELIKNDIAKVISRYMKIDTVNMDIQVSKKGSAGKKGQKSPVLCANIPILDLYK